MKWVYGFFVVLGVIFFFILLSLGYFIAVDPLNIRPVIMNMYFSGDTSVEESTTDTTLPTTNSESKTSTSVMTKQREAALEAVGISPEAVPSQFTPEQTNCFVDILGEERVNEIKAGATPTPSEFYQAKNCL